MDERGGGVGGEKEDEDRGVNVHQVSDEEIRPKTGTIRGKRG